MGKQHGKLEFPENSRPVINCDGTDCYLHIGNYDRSKLAMALQLVEKDSGEPYQTASVNLGNYSGNMSFVQLNGTFLDTNNMSDGTKNAVIDALGGQPYTRFGSPVVAQSGFCEYPLYEFNSQKLEEYDSAGYSRYKEEWQKECVKQQQKLNANLGSPYFEDEFEDIVNEEYVDEYDDEYDDDDEF